MMVQNEQGSWYENNHPPIGDCSLMLAVAKDAEIERLKAELAQFRRMWPMTWKDTEILRLKAQVKELSEAYQKAIWPIRPAEIDAEIERLKAEYLKLDEQLEQALRKNENQVTLISELCDALEGWPIRSPDLLQRAREATK